MGRRILEACNLLGLHLPPFPPNTDLNYALPSDSLGDDCVLTPTAISQIKETCELTNAKFDELFGKFKQKYESQKIFRHNTTDLNIFFCDFLLFARAKKYSISNYFDFEFWRKSRAEQFSFWG